jgi:hypothetical protein
MSVITLFTKRAPTIAGYEFDAALEDTLEASVTVTGYPIESGAFAADHRVIEPFRWQLVGAVSNNPIKPVVTDFVSALSDNPIAGFAAGLIAKSGETRGADTLSFLLGLMTGGEPFNVDTGEIQLQNMVITNITRPKDATNENGLIFIAQLQELPTLDTLLSGTGAKQFQLLDGDPSKSQAAELINRGEQVLRDAGSSVRNALGGIFG